MKDAYARAHSDWKANGGQMYVHFASIAAPGQYGEWGALESLLDTITPLSSAPPKWQAIQNFISGTPCWWSGCSGTVSSTQTPMAPTLISVK
jgi:hypothetical protein